MTYSGWNPDVLLVGLTCEYCGFRIIEEQVRLVPKNEQGDINLSVVVPVHAACKEKYHAK